MKLIQRDSTSLVLSPSSYSAYCGTQSVINDLDKYLSEPTQTERRCELYVELHPYSLPVQQVEHQQIRVELS